MRRPYYPWSLRNLLEGRPTLGSLLDLCEENYGLMLRLAPELAAMKGHQLSRREEPMDLHMDVLEQTPYTTRFRLTYRFFEEGQWQADPDAQFRAYHDLRQLEVLELRQQVLPLGGRPDLCSLQRKWQANLFVSKWLGYCCRQQHGFSQQKSIPAQPDVSLLCI